MHSIVMLCLAIAPRKKNALLLAAPCLAFSFVLRPTNAIAVCLVCLFIFLEHRDWFLKFILALGLSVLPFLVINLEVFGKIIPQYYNPGRLAPNFNALNPILANLFSPSRGLLFMSPVLLFAIYAAIKEYRSSFDSNFQKLLLLSTAFFTSHLVAVSIFPNWWGGHCFGARYMSDTLVHICFLMIPLIAALPLRKPNLQTALFVLCLALSVAIHYRGANAQIVYFWNTQPQNIDNNPYRVWDIYDIQVLRGL